jgi:hypothetical protein
MKQYEKTVDKALNTAEKVSRGANKLYIGCTMVLTNLCFLAFCLWGVYAGYNSWSLGRDGQTATGTVIKLAESSDGEGGCCVYSPVVEFQANGQTYTFESDNASNPPAYEVGESVSVIYNPADPATAQIDKWSERWLMPIILIPAMLFAMLITTIFSIRAWRRDEDVISNL